MDERHVYEATRYVENNPVMGKLSRKAWEYGWSSAKAHVKGQDDELVKVKPMQKRVEDWQSYLEEGVEEGMIRLFERHERTGRPLGDLRFLRKLERKTKRTLLPKCPGRPRIEK